MSGKRRKICISVVALLAAVFIFAGGVTLAVANSRDHLYNTEGYIVSTANCVVNKCWPGEYGESCSYNGTITLQYPWQDRQWWSEVTPNDLLCGDNCCSVLQEANTTIYIDLDENDPSHVLFYTDDPVSISTMRWLFIVFFIIVGLIGSCVSCIHLWEDCTL